MHVKIRTEVFFCVSVLGCSRARACFFFYFFFHGINICSWNTSIIRESESPRERKSMQMPFSYVLDKSWHWTWFVGNYRGIKTVYVIFFSCSRSRANCVHEHWARILSPSEICDRLSVGKQEVERGVKKIDDRNTCSFWDKFKKSIAKQSDAHRNRQQLYYFGFLWEMGQFCMLNRNGFFFHLT